MGTRLTPNVFSHLWPSGARVSAERDGEDATAKFAVVEFLPHLADLRPHGLHAVGDYDDPRDAGHDRDADRNRRHGNEHVALTRHDVRKGQILHVTSWSEPALYLWTTDPSIHLACAAWSR